MATKPVPAKGGSGKPATPTRKNGEQHLDLSHLSTTEDPPTKVTIPTPAQPAPAQMAPATAQPVAGEEEEEIPEGYAPPEEDNEDDPNAPAELDNEFEDDEEEVATLATAPVTNSNALNMARQFLQQREQVAAALREEASSKREQASQIMSQAQEQAAALIREADEAESLAANMSGQPVQASTPGAATGTRRRRKRQGVPNPSALTSDTTAPIAAPPASRMPPQPPPANESLSKAAQTRALNQGKSTKLGILATLRAHKCNSPKKTMALKEIGEWIVKRTEQGGYGYVTQSSQFGNIVRGQLDKLEQEGKIVFDDATGGYYLAPTQPTA